MCAGYNYRFLARWCALCVKCWQGDRQSHCFDTQQSIQTVTKKWTQNKATSVVHAGCGYRRRNNNIAVIATQSQTPHFINTDTCLWDKKLWAFCREQLWSVVVATPNFIYITCQAQQAFPSLRDSRCSSDLCVRVRVLRVRNKSLLFDPLSQISLSLAPCPPCSASQTHACSLLTLNTTELYSVWISASRKMRRNLQARVEEGETAVALHWQRQNERKHSEIGGRGSRCQDMSWTDVRTQVLHVQYRQSFLQHLSASQHLPQFVGEL